MISENEFRKAPVYLQIREAIYNKIISGEYKAGEKLPAEEKLAEEYGVSRMTVNKALMELVSREYLTRIQGSGTYVSKMRREGTKTRGMSFRDSLMKKGFKVDTIVLEKKMVYAEQRSCRDFKYLNYFAGYVFKTFKKST